MRLPVKLLLRCLSALLLLQAATAGPVAYGSVSKLVTDADAIVVGLVQSKFAAGTVSATVTVELVLKGSIVPGTLVSLVWVPSPSAFPLPSSPMARPTIGHGVFFLQRSANGTWSTLPVASGDIGYGGMHVPTPSNPPPGVRNVAEASLPAGDSPLDKVFVELVVAAEAGAPTPFDLVGNFRQSPSAVLSAAFGRFLQNPKLEAIGLRGSILAGDPAPILTIQRKYASLSSSPGWSDLLLEIRSYYANTTPQAIQTLGQIATDSTVGDDLRIATAGALSRMHTQQSLPHLAKLLSDKNVTVRILAAGGMASFANNVPIGSHEPAAGAWPYRTDDTIAHSGFDSANVAFWQTWWQQNQSKLAK